MKPRLFASSNEQWIRKMIVKSNSKIVSGGLLVAALLGAARTAHAQWLTQNIDLQAGWNAVFLHVDTTHDVLNAHVAGDINNPILEIWRWNPPSVAQFVDNPAQPTATPEWTFWVRTNPASALQRLNGDTAYLVRVGTNVSTYTWSLKGQPVAPRHSWTISGLNLIGFPTVVTNPAKFNAFLAQAPELQSATPEIYQYIGGDLSTNNPALLPSPLFAFTSVKRGQAFWIVNSADNGVDFATTRSSATLRLRNLSSSNLTVTLRLSASETPPLGQSNIAGVPPLLLRGALDLTNLTYGYTNLPVATPRTWTLAPRNLPGSEVEVVLGLDRSSITNAPGSLLAGILSFTDSLGHTSVQLPVTATAGSSTGLWVGDALVSQVAHYLKSYQRGPNNAPVASSNGNYVVTDTDTSLGDVSREYPLRLIVHNPDAGNAVLLQRVYYGFDSGTNVVVANGESALHPGYLKSARRITATHLPWSATNTVWPLGGRLGQATNLTAQVAVLFNDQAANPFLHTYHPDHDNLNATLDGVLSQGSESYRIERAITLLVQPPGEDFSSLVAAASTLTGEYREIVTLKGLARAGGTNDTRQFEVRGAFKLNRLSDVPALTLAP
jgi:hypothetical protein